MNDREKVLNGLRCLSGEKEMVENRCAGCGYIDCQTYAICIGQVTTDALELLKEQEPKSVLSERECETLPNHYERKGFCPKCHQVVAWYLNRAYCGFCGQAVKWND